MMSSVLNFKFMKVMIVAIVIAVIDHSDKKQLQYVAFDCAIRDFNVFPTSIAIRFLCACAS